MMEQALESEDINVLLNGSLLFLQGGGENLPIDPDPPRGIALLQRAAKKGCLLAYALLAIFGVNEVQVREGRSVDSLYMLFNNGRRACSNYMSSDLLSQFVRFIPDQEMALEWVQTGMIIDQEILESGVTRDYVI